MSWSIRDTARSIRLDRVPSEAEREWLRQWSRATTALADQRGRELAAMSDEDALAAADAVLDLAALAPLNPDRVSSSGLVEQQALFHRRSR
jgi:hypothetical protein